MRKGNCTEGEDGSLRVSFAGAWSGWLEVVRESLDPLRGGGDALVAFPRGGADLW